jgi:hypothetical protein
MRVLAPTDFGVALNLEKKSFYLFQICSNKLCLYYALILPKLRFSDSEEHELSSF